MKTLVSHSTVGPFVQQVALAFHEVGWLDRYVTTLLYDPASRGQRMASRLSKLVGFDLERQLRRRAVNILPREKLESLPWGEIMRLVAERVDRGGRIADLVWEKVEPAFDRAVARRLSDRLDAVYGFEYSSLATFTRARELGLRVFYDMPAPEPGFVQKLLDDEATKFPVLRTPYYHHTAVREAPRIARRRAEWEKADIVLAGSTFTRDSFAKAGIDTAKVRVVNLGAPPAVATDEAVRGGSTEGPLKLLWAGTFSVRKGAHYLLEAWRRHGLGRHARLQVFGALTLPDSLMHPIPEGVEFGGSIPRTELMAHYQSSDALLFPTLCDGFGMVVTEAWSRGLPVLTTRAAGAADLLHVGENGLLFEPGDPDSLADSVRWCLDHRAELRSMRGPSAETARAWQWSDYRAALRKALTPDVAI